MIQIPANRVGQEQPSFQIYLGRSLIDLTFFVIVSVVGLQVIAALLIVKFTELRVEIVRLAQKCRICFHDYYRMQLKERIRKISVLFVVLRVIALNVRAR